MRVVVTGGSGFIGTNLTKYLADKGHQFLNLDIVAPKLENLNEFWVRCDICNNKDLLDSFRAFRPDAVVHLAAETDTNPRKTMQDYEVNVVGTRNVINAIRETSTVQRVVFTSTQFVNQSEKGPSHDEDYAPHTIYGESKVINEKDIRASNLHVIWTIIRPTNVWGPWHLRYPYEFWKVLSNGMYFHPGRQPVMRSYGYVGNVVNQIVTILESAESKINQQIFYVGDPAIDLYDWVNGFSVHQVGKRVRVIPRIFVRVLAIIGDLLFILKIKFPITSSRYRSMTTGNIAPMDKTFQKLGMPPYSLEAGIKETVDWMKNHFPSLVKKSNVSS